MRILLANSNHEVLRVLEGLLKNVPARIDCADSCRLTRFLLKTHFYEWIILDYLFEDGSGLEIIKSLRQSRRPTRALLVTGQAESLELHAQADASGTTPILPKFDFAADLKIRIGDPVVIGGDEA